MSTRKLPYDLIQLIKGGSIEQRIVQSQKETIPSLPAFQSLSNIRDISDICICVRIYTHSRTHVYTVTASR